MSTIFSVADLRRQLVLLDDEIEQLREAALRAHREAEAADDAVETATINREGASRFIDALENAADSATANVVPHLPDGVLDAARAEVDKRANGNAEAILTILHAQPQGVHIHELQAETKLTGEQVRSAVAYLRRRGDVERAARGVWRPAMHRSSSNTDSVDYDGDDDD